MTPLARTALQWFERHGPIGWFDHAAPTATMRRRLVRLGYVEEIRPVVGLLKYQVTKTGREALNK